MRLWWKGREHRSRARALAASTHLGGCVDEERRLCFHGVKRIAEFSQHTLIRARLSAGIKHQPDVEHERVAVVSFIADPQRVADNLVPAGHNCDNLAAQLRLRDNIIRDAIEDVRG